MNNAERKMKRRRGQSALVFSALCACLLMLIVLNLAIGDENIGLWDVMKSLAGQGDAGVRFLVMEFRMPRILLAVLAGGALSIAGVVAQSLMKNPLAAPDTLGITGGAGLGAVIVTVLFSQQSPLLLTGAAFSGSVLAAALVYLLAYRNGISPVRLALVGIAVNAFAIRVFSYSFQGEPECQQRINLAEWKSVGRDWDDVLSLFIWCCLVIPPLWFAAKPLDIIKSGDGIAVGLGIRLERTRFLLLAGAVLLTAAAVTAVGTIGFIGLMAPHIARKLAGAETRILIPVSALVGGIVL